MTLATRMVSLSRQLPRMST
ncbi:hypothetical protein M3J09_001765 [Ascochyta lentis]